MHGWVRVFEQVNGAKRAEFCAPTARGRDEDDADHYNNSSKESNLPDLSTNKQKWNPKLDCHELLLKEEERLT
jgi:hypothetical protein